MSAASRLDVERIADMRDRGMSVKDIAADQGCSRGAVAWHCLRAGVTLKEHPIGRDIHPHRRRNGQIVRPFSVEEDERIVRLTVEGKTPTEVARAVGRKNTSIIARLATLARREEAELERAAAETVVNDVAVLSGGFASEMGAAGMGNGL